MSVSHLLIAMVVDTFALLGVLYGNKIILNNKLYCKIIATFCVTSCSTAYLHIALVAFNRFF